MNLPPYKMVGELVEVFGLSWKDADRLSMDAKVLDYFEEILDKQHRRDQLFCRISAKWILNDLFQMLNRNKTRIEDCPVSARHFGSLLSLLIDKRISRWMAKNLLEIMWVELADPETILKELDFDTAIDEKELSEIVETVFKDFPVEVDKALNNPRVSSFLIGQAVGRAYGRADPAMLSGLVADGLKIYRDSKGI